jgi:hypothetical protein
MALLTPQIGCGKEPASLPDHGHLLRFPRQLFIHCVASLPGFRQLAPHVPGVDKYAERALLLARADDLVCVAHRVSPAYLDFLNQLDLGPNPAHIIQLPGSTNKQTAVPMVTRLRHYLSSEIRLPKVLAGSHEVWLNCFAASELDTQLQSCLATLLDRRVLSVNRHPGKGANLYDKHVVRQQARASGLPLPPGESVTLDRQAATRSSQALPVRRAIDKYLGATGRVIVRGALGASGSSVFVVSRDECDVQRCLRSVMQQGHTDVFLVEPFYDVSVSPNIGMFIDPRDGSISCVSVSDQILDGQVRHLGNRFPSQAHLTDQMVAAATRFCRWLREQGTTGFLGFDFCEYRVPGSTRRQFFFAELNPRFNGATYPAHLLARLNTKAGHDGVPRWREFRALTVQTNLRVFSALQALCGDLLFDGREVAGIIPYNVGLLQHGKLMLVIVGETHDDVESLHDEFCHRASDNKAQVRGSRWNETAA